MSTLNIPRARALLQQFDFKTLFIEALGWARAGGRPDTITAGGVAFHCRPIAQLAGALVYEATTPAGDIPDAKTRAALHAEIEKRHFEHLLIFIDGARQQSLWSWVKHDGGKRFPRSHYYARAQPGDLFLSKLSAIVVDISELDEAGHLPVAEVASRLRRALDVERVTRRFYNEFQDLLIDFADQITGIDDPRDRRWYASVLLNRLMFVYFLQRKFYLDGGDAEYTRRKLEQSKQRGKDQYYTAFLRTLFFEGFAKPPEQRSAQARHLIGDIVYLNGGLFLPHPVEERWPAIAIPDAAFDALFDLFGRYSWNLDDTPGGDDNEINPDVLGYIFEKYINQKEFGAYYTRAEITGYLCERTIHPLILDAVNAHQDALAAAGLSSAPRRFDSMDDLLMGLDADLCKLLLHDTLPRLSLLDPACGSGAFLVAAMKTLIAIYTAVIGRIPALGDRALSDWLARVEREHRNIAYFIRKSIITNNLFGVDIMPEAVEIARLRLFLALVASAQGPDHLEPLPNIDFNILAGNSLIGLLRVDEAAYEQRHRQGNLFYKPYRELVAERNRLVRAYRNAAGYTRDLAALRDAIQAHREQAIAALNEMLLDEFTALGIQFEQATWDEQKGQPGRPRKRAARLSDIEALRPFHWGYEFDEVMAPASGGSGERAGCGAGFDAIITNPPWEIFKPQAKEFFAEYSDLVAKNKMTIKAFEKEQARLLKNAAVRNAWLEYQSRFPHVSAWFRAAPQFANQIAIVNGKKAGSDINLYKLFVEQCFNLLRPGGRCGIVVPSGIYTDLGARQLREMLFGQTRISGLFGFENRKAIFENVDSRFKFVVLTFEKGGRTESFPAAFMRHEVAELERFPQQGGLPVSVELVHRLSPDSLSVMEFKSDLDARIAEKMLCFPLLGQRIDGVWNLRLTREFDMTNDSHLFKTRPGAGRLPLYEGKMIHQFDAHFAGPRYWVDEKQGRRALLGKAPDTGQTLDYQGYRLGFRDIARNTDTRTLISTIIPPAFHGNKIPTVRIYDDDGSTLIEPDQQIFLCAIWNSFVIDWMLRLKVTTTVNFFYLFQLPVPRLTAQDAAFRPIVERAARLICVTPQFDDLAKAVGIEPPRRPLSDAERGALRAGLDGLIARLYGLTEAEFAHVLSGFPLVAQEVKDAALAAYRGATGVGLV